MFLLNAFSLNMVSDFPVTIHFKEISLEEARQLADTCQFAVGHPDTACVFSEQLGIEVPANRVSVTLNKGGKALIGQYRGPRLPEGATILLEGADRYLGCSRGSVKP